jgi:hypothetical protein
MGAAITMTSELVDSVQSSRAQVAGQGKKGAAAERRGGGNGERPAAGLAAGSWAATACSTAPVPTVPDLIFQLLLLQATGRKRSSGEDELLVGASGGRGACACDPRAVQLGLCLLAEPVSHPVYP